MCLGIPAQIIERFDVERAVIDLGGIQKEISIALVPEVVVGDFVIVHVGYALARLDEVEAHKTLALFEAMLGDAS